MATHLLTLILATVSLRPAWGLQVTPNSGCASVCTDYYGADPSDPNVSNTNGSDVVCTDSDYSTTLAGFKYRSCIDCLQNSSAATAGETDQAWFTYNLRYTVNSCLFTATNASNRIESPCALSSICNPLRSALETDMRKPSKANQFSYCTANETGIGFMSSYLVACQECLRDSTNASYLSNFLVALDAGCTQRPANGTLIGLNGTLFSHDVVQVVIPVVALTEVSKVPQNGLTRVAVAGIVVGVSGVLLAAATCIFICIKKYRNAQGLQRHRNLSDSRFGSANISAPATDAYASPEDSPPMGGMYKSPRTSPSIKTESIKVSCAPSIRNFSMRNFGLGTPNPGKRNRGRIDTQRGQKTLDSFSPGPRSFSSQNSSPDPFPAHHAYVQTIPLPQINETSKRGYSLKPLASNPPAAAGHYIPPPARVRFPQTVPHVTTTIPSTYNHSRGQGSVSSTWAISATHEHPPDAQISAPIMTLGTRFESEAEAREARDILRRGGTSGTSMRRKWQGSIDVKSPAEKASPSSASTAVSPEMWPGSF